MTDQSKWEGLPLYDRPLGNETAGTDDGREVAWITDFSSCAGEGFGEWAAVDYATERFSGKLLHAHRSAPAGEVTVPLNVEWWYAVYVWLMGGDADLEGLYPADFDSVYSQSKGPALKLSGDPYFSGQFRVLSHDKMMWPGLEACFWRYADLSGQSLTIAHQGGTVYLGAIQLVPLSPAEVEAVQPKAETKRLIIKCDEPSAREFEPMVEHLRNRDVAAWIVGNENSEDIFSPEALNLRAGMRIAHEIGAEYYVCERPSLWSAHFHWGDRRTEFFGQHPEWRCKDRDGADTHQMSYAVPEVVDYMLDRVRACAKIAPEGYGFFFNRDPGLVLFEPAAMQGFEERYGVDPLTLDDRDDRLLDWRAEIITDFLRKVRATLDEVSPNKRIKLVNVVLGNEAANRFFSYDVARWVREGLADVLLVYPWVDYPDRWLAQGFVDADIRYFAGLVRGTECKLYSMWLSGIWRAHWTPEHVRMNEYFQKALRDYEDGADGISAWDFVGLDRAFTTDRWLRLGHKDQLAEWATADFPLPPKLRFTRYAGRTPDRYPTGSGG
ncbi:MAG: hypothetical protein ACYDCO_19295 [Armatimonadota bacterium]